MDPSCIIVTAKGMPDLATRLFISRLNEAFPDMIMAAGELWYLIVTSMHTITESEPTLIYAACP